MFSIKQLKRKREEMGLSQTDVARYLNIARMSYNNWESGKTKPNQKNLIELARLFKVDPALFESEYHIVTNYLKLTSTNQNKADQYVEQLLETQQQEENKVIPLFGVEVYSDLALSAGPGSSLFDEYETETVYSDEEQYGFDLAAWIDGTSMEPVYKDREVALIRATGFDYDGAVYALSWNDSIYIKKLYREETGFRMVSINKSHPDRFIPYEDEPRIVGLVVGHFMPVEGV